MKQMGKMSTDVISTAWDRCFPEAWNNCPRIHRWLLPEQQASSGGTGPCQSALWSGERNTTVSTFCEMSSACTHIYRDTPERNQCASQKTEQLECTLLLYWVVTRAEGEPRATRSAGPPQKNRSNTVRISSAKLDSIENRRFLWLINDEINWSLT